MLENSQVRHRFGWVLLAALCTLHSALCTHAQSVTTATLAITNAAGTTNGNTVVIQGTTYLWTNTPASLSQIATTNTPAAAATNLYTKFRTALTNRFLVSYGSSTSVLIKTFVGQTLTASINTNWGVLTFATNTAGNASVGASNLVASRISLSGETITAWSDLGAASIGDGTLTTNKVDETFHELLVSGGSDPNAITNNNASAVTLADDLAIGGIFTLSDTPSNHIAAAGDTLVLSAGSGTSQIKIQDTSTGITFTGVLNGDGYGVTNIPLAGVNGLPTALDWLTNNAGGISQATASAMMADGTNTFAGDGGGLTNLNAAMLSGQVSTNNLTTTKTNWDVKHDFALDTTAVNPQQVKNFKAALYNREKVVMSFVGDSVGQDVQPVMELALLPFMDRAGAIAASTPSYLGNYFYAGAPTGTTTPYATGLDGVFWGGFSALGNGAVQTVSSELSNGIVATVVGMAWVGWSGGGSMLVETQAYSGSWGTIGTLNSGGTTFQMHTTNWTVPLTNYFMRVTATGSNLPVSFALTDRGTGAGFISSATTTPGMYPIQRMQSAGSNNVATYLLWQNPDVVFYKAERADTALTEVPWLNGVLTNTLPNCDLVLIAYHENTDPIQSYTNRQNFVAMAKQMGRAFVDTYAESTPYQNSLDAGLYNADEVHLVDVGRAVLHGRMPTQLGVGLDGMLALNYQLPSGSLSQTNDTTKANLAGGNTFTGVQRSINDTYFGGFVNTTNGVILWGANADLALRNKDSQVQQALINYKTAIRFQESVTSYKNILSISNDVGTPTFSYDPTGYNPPKIGLPATPWGNAFFKIYTVSSNATSGWPAAPQKAGDAIIVNSNGVAYLLESGTGSTWTGTNQISAGSGTTYTNSSQAAGWIVGSGIGTNVYANLTNGFTGTGAIVLSNAPTLYNANLTGETAMENLIATNFFPGPTNAVLMAGADGATTNLTLDNSLGLTGTTLAAAGSYASGTFYENDDFTRMRFFVSNGQNQVGDLGWYYWIIVGGSLGAPMSPNAYTTNAPRIGIQQLNNTSTTANQGFQFSPTSQYESNLQPLARPDLWTNWQCRFVVRALNTNGVNYRIGMMGGTTYALIGDPQHGSYFRFNTNSAGNSSWSLIVKNATTSTTNTMEVADVHAFHTFRLFNDTGITNIVRAQIDSGTIVSVTNALNDSTVAPQIYGHSLGGTGTAPMLWIDYYDFYLNVVTR